MTRRRSGVGIAAAALVVAALLAGAVPASAGANRCMYNGQEYEEGTLICQAGLVNLCMNGVWQSKGSFCNETPDGGVIGGGGGSAPVVIEVPAPAEDED
jgi:hypothetical protein